MKVSTEDQRGGRLGIVWAVVGVLAAVAKAAVWIVEKADKDTKELHGHRFERQATEDQEDGDDD